DSMVQSGIEPRIPGIGFQPAPFDSGAVAFVARIPRGFAAPHMVTFQGSQRFYSRNNAGKYPLDVVELRTAFLAAGQLAERVRNFRLERLGRILANETPVGMATGAKVVLHLAPLAAYDRLQQIDTTSLRGNTLLRPLNGFVSNGRHNFDGWITSTSDGGLSGSYAQLFRNGSIETVDSMLLDPGRRPIPITLLER